MGLRSGAMSATERRLLNERSISQEGVTGGGPPGGSGRLAAMSMVRLVVALCVTVGGFAQAPGTVANTSVYSSLDEKVCKTVSVGEGSSEQVCPGVAGYRLRVLDGDARMSVTVVRPDGSQHDLRFMETVSGGFSSLGPRAEWRMRQGPRGGEPVALTVRLNAQEDAANPTRVTSYVVVARLDGPQVCVVKVIRSSATALEEARGVADHAGELACLRGR